MSRQLIKMNDSTYRIEEGFVRFFLLLGDKKAVLLDTGASGENVTELIRSVTDKEIILVNTHGDGDHTASNAEFRSFGIGRADYVAKDMAALYPGSSPVFLEDGMVIDPGNRPLEIISVPGHTNGSVVVLDRKNRLLFSGDSVQNGCIYMFGPHRAPDCFATSLTKLIQRENDFNTVCPSHGLPELPPDYTEKVLGCWEQYRAGLLPFSEVSLHGRQVRQYSGEYCGFYVD